MNKWCCLYPSINRLYTISLNFLPYSEHCRDVMMNIWFLRKRERISYIRVASEFCIFSLASQSIRALLSTLPRSVRSHSCRFRWRQQVAPLNKTWILSAKRILITRGFQFIDVVGLREFQNRTLFLYRSRNNEIVAKNRQNRYYCKYTYIIITRRINLWVLHKFWQIFTHIICSKDCILRRTLLTL